MFDFENSYENLLHYGQTTAKEINLKKKKDIPIAIFAGLSDLLVEPNDTQWIKDQLYEDLVYYKEFNLGHMSYLTAKDMSYFSENVIDLVKAYHPLPPHLQLEEMM